MHISRERLAELATLDVVFGEREWPHLRDCESCMNKFVEAVRLKAEEGEDEES